MRKNIFGVLALAGLLALVIFYPFHSVKAQGTTGYTKVGTVTGLTFTDTTVADGSVYNYEVTASNAAGESGPSNIITVTIPASGTHSVAASWSASTGATSYSVYRFLVQVPAAPSGFQAVVN